MSSGSSESGSVGWLCLDCGKSYKSSGICPDCGSHNAKQSQPSTAGDSTPQPTCQNCGHVRMYHTQDSGCSLRPHGVRCKCDRWYAGTPPDESDQAVSGGPGAERVSLKDELGYGALSRELATLADLIERRLLPNQYYVKRLLLASEKFAALAPADPVESEQIMDESAPVAPGEGDTPFDQTVRKLLGKQMRRDHEAMEKLRSYVTKTRRWYWEMGEGLTLLPEWVHKEDHHLFGEGRKNPADAILGTPKGDGE